MVIPEPARSWALRWGVELSAAPAFSRLARELEDLGYPRAFVDAAKGASSDEERHAKLCEELTLHYGATAPADLEEPLTFAPKSMPRAQALLFDIAARCCIAETESMATLVTLLPLGEGRAREVVHEISRDEMRHSRLGWEILRYAHEQKRDLAFLGPHLVSMLRANGDDVFGAAHDPGSGKDGVLSTEQKKDVFVECVRDIVLPGFELIGVDTKGAHAWLDKHVAARAPHTPNTPNTTE